MIAKYAPYAPLGNVVAVLDRLRDGWKPETIDAEDLIASGVSEGNAPRTLAALEFLGLVEGKTALPAARELAEAPAAEYKPFLAGLLKESYKEILGKIDPETSTDSEIEDAFRTYSPATQKGRMSTLFIGLCQLAGLRPGSPRLLSEPRKARKRDDSGGGKARYLVWAEVLKPHLEMLPADGEEETGFTENELEAWISSLKSFLDMRIKPKK